MNKAGPVVVGLIIGYGMHAWLHRNEIAAEQHWHDLGGMAGRYDIVKGQCEAARAAYFKERDAVIRTLSQDANRYGVAINDSSYLKAELVCDAGK